MRAPGSLRVLLVACTLAGCNGQSGRVDDFGGLGVVDVPPRRGSVAILSCSLDDGQRAALESSAVEKLAVDVIFLCFGIDSLGQAQPSSATSRQAFAKQAEWVAGLGYRAKVGLSLRDPSSVPAKSGARSPFSSAALRAKVVASVLEVAGYGDGVELDLRHLPDAARGDVTKLVTQIAGVVRPRETLGVLVPAANLAQGGAVDMAAVAVRVDRVRVMTLDDSLGRGSGPAFDSGGAVDSARLALAAAGQTPVDVALPLNGRQIWFDAVQSTVLTLAAWPTTVLPGGVGVVFYDLGAEDPGVWKAIEEATP